MLNEINRYLMEASNTYNITMMKIDAVTEAVSREYKINCASAELKVVQENGTSDDLKYLLEEAGKGLVQRVIETLHKIKDAIIKFLRNIKAKILSIFNKTDNMETVEKIEKKIKFFPLIGKKKVKVIDKDAIDKNVNEHTSKLSRLLSKVKGKQHVDPDEIEQIEDSFFDRHRKLIAASTVTVTAVSLIGLWKKFGSKTNDTVNRELANVSEAIDGAIDVANDIANDLGDPVIGQSIEKIGRATSNIIKAQAESDVIYSHNILSKLKSAITGIKGGNTPVETESSLYENSYFGYNFFEDDADVDTDVETDTTDNTSDSSSNTNNTVDECGDYDDPINYIDPDFDDETDVWNDDIERETPSDLNDAFESAFSDLYSDIISDPCDCGYDDKPDNNSIVSSLYDQIDALGSGDKKNINENTFESLMSDIDSLEFL